MYQAPATNFAQTGPTSMANAGDDSAVQEHFDDFYEEVYEELANFGKVEELVVCANLGDHMIGNVYVKVYFPFLLL
jgi:splicing factor U2AF 35 kDa subunit